MANVPYHADVVRFASALAERVRARGHGDYGLACEHAHSCCTLLARRDRYWRADAWWTWIDYDRFQELAAAGAQFGAEDYAAPTPSWAVAGSEEAGFAPGQTRVRKERRHHHAEGATPLPPATPPAVKA